MALEKFKVFNDWFSHINEHIAHLKYQIESNEINSSLSADLDNTWADINIHQNEFHDLQNIFKSGNISIKFAEEPLNVMNNSKSIIDNLRYKNSSTFFYHSLIQLFQFL